MLKRFEGRGLETALCEQVAVAHDLATARSLVAVARVVEHKAAAMIIQTDASDTDVFFVLSGSVGIEVKGRQIATRHAGQHFGEMALIDPTAKRSATVRALEQTVTASVSEEDFAKIASEHPGLWRRLALELGKRLRERSQHIRQTNEKPEIFIGSTAERLEIPRALQGSCAHDSWVTRIWTDGVFGAGKTPIESLSAQLERLDFGLLVVTADDLTEARGKEAATPRDNVIFELGLLYGALGRERTFMVRVRDEWNLKLPTDLVGVRALEILPGKPDELATRVGPAMTEFRHIVAKLGVR